MEGLNQCSTDTGGNGCEKHVGSPWWLLREEDGETEESRIPADATS